MKKYLLVSACFLMALGGCGSPDPVNLTPKEGHVTSIPKETDGRGVSSWGTPIAYYSAKTYNGNWGMYYSPNGIDYCRYRVQSALNYAALRQSTSGYFYSNRYYYVRAECANGNITSSGYGYGPIQYVFDRVKGLGWGHCIFITNS